MGKNFLDNFFDAADNVLGTAEKVLLPVEDDEPADEEPEDDDEPACEDVAAKWETVQQNDLLIARTLDDGNHLTRDRKVVLCGHNSPVVEAFKLSVKTGNLNMCIQCLWKSNGHG